MNEVNMSIIPILIYFSLFGALHILTSDTYIYDTSQTKWNLST